jgi:hypothetical protein
MQGIGHTAGPDDKVSLDMVLASTNADSTIRTSAVNHLLDTLAQKAELSPPEKVFEIIL